MLDAHSPLASQLQPGLHGLTSKAPGVRIRERSITSLVQISAWPETVDTVLDRLGKTLGLTRPVTALHNAGTAEMLVSQTAPLKMLVCQHQDAVQDLAQAFDSSEAVVTELSHSRCCLRLSGDDAQTLLNRGLPLDFASMAAGTVVSSALHGVPLLIHLADNACVSMVGYG